MTAPAPRSSPWRARGIVALLIAGVLVLLASGLIPGCGDEATTEPVPNGDDPAVERDPEVVAALERRPDLAQHRVIVLGMDGADPRQIRSMVDEGRLPHFERLMQEGAWGPLRSQEPMLSPLLWTSIATGKWPTEHGVLDFLVRDEADPDRRVTVTSRTRQVEALWDIVGRYDRSVGLVAWLASHPAEQVNGFAVSERTELLAYLFNQQVEASDEGKSWPPELIGTVEPLRRLPRHIPYAEVDPFLDVTEEEWNASFTGPEFTNDNRTNNLRLIFAAADNFRRIGLKLHRERTPDLFCIYFEAIDATAHNFMAYTDPVNWKPRSPEEIAELRPKAPPALVQAVWSRIHEPDAGDRASRDALIAAAQPAAIAELVELARGAEPDLIRRWGDAVKAMLEWHDRLLGEFMDAMDENTTLLVVSDHGFAWGPRKPPFDSSFNSRLGGARFHTPEGILGIFGNGVRPGFRFPPFDPDAERTGARLLDIAPTALALMGFPKADDMPGRVLTEAFDLDLATGSVASYEVGRAVRLIREREERRRQRDEDDPDDPLSMEAMSEQMEALVAIGYVGSGDDAPVRPLLHMARSYLEQERFEEAREAYLEALAVATGDQRENVLFFLGQLALREGDIEEADQRFREGLEAAPNSIPLTFGLIRVAKERRDTEAVRRGWEAIVRLQPREPTYRVQLANAMRAHAVKSGPRALAEDLPGALRLVEDALIEAAERSETGTDTDDLLGPAGRNIRGMILLDLGRRDEAIADFEAAAAAHPRFVQPRNNLGVVHMRWAWTETQALSQATDDETRRRHFEAMMTHRGAALRWFDEVIRLKPEHAKSRYNRAEVLIRFPSVTAEEARNNRDIAIGELRKALAIDPRYTKARQLLERLEAAAAADPGPGAPDAPDPVETPTAPGDEGDAR